MIRRKQMAAAAACVMLLAASAPLQALAGETAEDKWREQVEITAHRGDNSKAPENTLPAFMAAVETGADWIELDVTQTRDGVLVVFHDADLMRITGRPDKIWEMDYETLRQIDIAGHWGPFYKGTRIPSLEEVLDSCKSKIRLNIEVKVNGHQTSDFIPSLVRLIQAKGMTGECMITSFDYGCLQQVRLLEPALETGYISSNPIGQPEVYQDADNFVLSIDLIDPDTVSRIHALGKEVTAWTVNDAYSMNRCRKAGADNLITDKPGKIMAQ